MEKRYEILLFDVDGTLLDFDRAEHAAMEKIFARHGYPYSEETLLRYREINSQLWRDYEQDRILKPVIHMTRFEQLFREFSIEGDGAAFNREYLDALSAEHFTIDAAEEVCAALSGRYRMYVVTNGVSHVQRRRMRESGLEQYFSDLFISEEMGVQKPKREFFELVSHAVENFAPEKTLVIGDSPTSDVKGAQGFGLDACWFNPAGRPAPSPAPTQEIRSLRELLPLL